MPRLNVTAMLLLPVLALSACVSIPPASNPVDVPPPKLAPPPPDVMVQRLPNFRLRLLGIFSLSSMTPTTPPDNSPPVSK